MQALEPVILRIRVEGRTRQEIADALGLEQKQITRTKKYGITPSMSRRGNWYDNAPAENFFSILKAERLRRQKPKSPELARLLIHDYIHF